MIVTWAEKVEGRGRAKSSCPRNNFPCDKTYFKEGNYFDGYGRCKGIYFDDHSLLSTFSSMTSLDVYFDAHATQLELSFRSDVWRAFTYLHVWDKAFLDKKRNFVEALNIRALLFECTVFFRHVSLFIHVSQRFQLTRRREKSHLAINQRMTPV